MITNSARSTPALRGLGCVLLASALAACSSAPCAEDFGRAADGLCYPLASASGGDDLVDTDGYSGADSDLGSDTDTGAGSDSSTDSDDDTSCGGCAEDADRDGYNQNEDCDESDPLVNPAAQESPCNNVDEDCDGLEDDHPDSDGDGYDACPEGVPGADNNPADCDDDDASVSPDALEIGDGADNDCDGLILIEAGPFLMGAETLPEFGPLHEVDVPGFEFHRYEVTNAEYAAFLNDVGSNICSGGTECYDLDDNEMDGRLYMDGETWLVQEGWKQHPVVEVSWYGALDYCEWAGLRLPSEAEWEKAARGGCELRGDADCDPTEDIPSYPWGADTVSPKDTHYANASRILGTTAPVGSYPLSDSPYGVSDLSGNVWEWTADCWHPDYHGAPTDGRAWTDPCDGDLRPRRGGGYSLDITEATVYLRFSNSQPSSNNDAGFRCARSLP